MSQAEMIEQRGKASPRLKARIAGFFYLLTFCAGIFSFLDRSKWGMAAGVIAGMFYMAVTALFYYLFKPVDRNLSLIAALASLAGFITGVLGSFHLDPLHINALVFFGMYCLLIGNLIIRSTFLPRILGVLMALAGLGWLTFLSANLANYLAPYNMVPGFLGEGALTVWLLVMGVNEERWREQAGAAEKSWS